MFINHIDAVELCNKMKSFLDDLTGEFHDAFFKVNPSAQHFRKVDLFSYITDQNEDTLIYEEKNNEYQDTEYSFTHKGTKMNIRKSGKLDLLITIFTDYQGQEVSVSVMMSINSMEIDKSAKAFHLIERCGDNSFMIFDQDNSLVFLEGRIVGKKFRPTEINYYRCNNIDTVSLYSRLLYRFGSKRTQHCELGPAVIRFTATGAIKKSIDVINGKVFKIPRKTTYTLVDAVLEYGTIPDRLINQYWPEHASATNQEVVILDAANVITVFNMTSMVRHKAEHVTGRAGTKGDFVLVKFNQIKQVHGEMFSAIAIMRADGVIERIHVECGIHQPDPYGAYYIECLSNGKTICHKTPHPKLDAFTKKD